MLVIAVLLTGRSVADDVWPAPPPVYVGGGRFTDVRFTTKAYHDEAFKLVLEEANKAANQLKLETCLPLTSSNIVESFISPYEYARESHCIGNMTTSNYMYGVCEGCKLSFVECAHQDQWCRTFQRNYTWPTNRIDFKEAYQQATQWLQLASMDVEALNRDCKWTVELDHYSVDPPRGKFVPVYWIIWKLGTNAGAPASVELFTPTKTLLGLRMEDSKYILRPPLVFTNLQKLISSP